LGITIIHLLTRTSPNNLPNKDLKIQFRDRITVSPQFANWLDKMIAPAVEKRYKTAIAALKYLPEISQDLATINENNFPTKLDKVASEDKNNKPVGSQIKIQKDSDYIDIVIPGLGFIALNNLFNNLLSKGNNFMPLLLVGSIIILFSKEIIFLLLRMIFSPVIIIILIILSLTYRNFHNLFITTRLQCDRKQFSIIKSFGSFTNIQKGITTTINDISLNYVHDYFAQKRNDNKLTINSLIINTKSTSKLHSQNTYIIGETLTEAELLWLVKELRNWLNDGEKLSDNISDLGKELDSDELNKEN
ncbi:MAG: hypothetical protein AB4372_07290, partial [Xenococcus sp. (in: cyanobacteria)]